MHRKKRMSYINSRTVKERSSFKFHCIVFDKIIEMQILLLKSALGIFKYNDDFNANNYTVNE